jgi:uncharacterized linocin/CFP29 family protein
MNRLLRNVAPLSDAAWEAVEEEAKRALTTFLAARRIVDFVGPLGWDVACVPTGHTTPIEGFSDLGVRARRRRAVELVEIRTPFTLDREVFETIDRGADDADLSAVVQAAKQAALAEDLSVFHGTPGAQDGAGSGIAGITTSTPHAPITLDADFANYPKQVAEAVTTLQEAGVAGPYALALGTKAHVGVIETTESGGYPLLKHLHSILGGPVVWARAVEGAIVVSQRGGDIEFVSGGDFAIGYSSHDATNVELYLEESFAVRINGPEAAVALTHG